MEMKLIGYKECGVIVGHLCKFFRESSKLNFEPFPSSKIQFHMHEQAAKFDFEAKYSNQFKGNL